MFEHHAPSHDFHLSRRFRITVLVVVALLPLFQPGIGFKTQTERNTCLVYVWDYP